MARDRYQLNELRNIVAQNQQRQQQQLKMWSLPLMIFEMTSYTARFYQYIAQWHPLCGSADSRATVNNILYLLPSSIWTCKVRLIIFENFSWLLLICCIIIVLGSSSTTITVILIIHDDFHVHHLDVDWYSRVEENSKLFKWKC